MPELSGYAAAGALKGTEELVADQLGVTVNVTPAQIQLYAAGAVTPEQYGAKGDNATDDTVAINLALASGYPVFFQPLKTYLVSGQLLMQSSRQTMFSSSGELSAFLHLTYTAGPAIVVGTAASLTQDVQIRNLYLIGTIGQTMFETRWVRGLKFFNCRIDCDQWMALGRISDGGSAATFIVEAYGTEVDQVASATKNFVEAFNFLGALRFDVGTTGTGRGIAGLHGFTARTNIHPIDDLQVIGGYWSIFQNNWDFTDCRITNAKWVGHHSEGGLGHAWCFDVSSSTAKAVGQVGWQVVEIIGCTGDSVDNVVLFNCARNTDNIAMDTFQVIGLECNQSSTKTLVKVSTTTTSLLSPIRHGQISGVSGVITPADANQDAVGLIGNASAGAISVIQVDQVNPIASGTALRSGVRIEGSGTAAISVGDLIGGTNLTKAVDDQTGLAIIAGKRWKNATLSFGLVGSGATATQTVALTGIKTATDISILNVTGGGPPAGLIFDSVVSADDVVTVLCHNPTAGGLTANNVIFRVCVVLVV